MSEKLLFYQWGSVCDLQMKKVLEEYEIEHCVFAKKMADYHADAEFAMEFLQFIHQEQIKAVLSFDYFPLISMLCEMNQIPYISWIYDCPMYTLYSKTVTNGANYIFSFDRKLEYFLQQMGVCHCVHYPLAARAKRLEDIKQTETAEIRKKYSCDISFVGNLYNATKNRLRNAKLSDYTRGYLQGIMESQLKIYGYNFIKEALTEDIMKEIVEKCQLSLGDMYFQDLTQLAADSVGMEVSAREREQVLRILGTYFKVDLYSGSELPVDFKDLNIKTRGFADYEKEMPYIFHNSKINLNITSKTIESGIPLRVFDILSCGGFCLTNYQPEIGEYFVDGEDLVMYSGMEDLVEKAAYYLEHEKEREQIARNGYEKLKKNHELGMMVKEMLSFL